MLTGWLGEHSFVQMVYYFDIKVRMSHFSPEPSDFDVTSSVIFFIGRFVLKAFSAQLCKGGSVSTVWPALTSLTSLSCMVRKPPTHSFCRGLFPAPIARRTWK